MVTADRGAILEVYQYKARMKHRSWHENITTELEHMQFEHGSKLAMFSVP